MLIHLFMRSIGIRKPFNCPTFKDSSSWLNATVIFERFFRVVAMETKQVNSIATLNIYFCSASIQCIEQQETLKHSAMKIEAALKQKHSKRIFLSKRSFSIGSFVVEETQKIHRKFCYSIYLENQRQEKSLSVCSQFTVEKSKYQRRNSLDFFSHPAGVIAFFIALLSLYA